MPKVVQVAYGSGQFTKFKSQFKRGFTEMVLTRAGRLREWSKGELWLHDRDQRIEGSLEITGGLLIPERKMIVS